MIGPDNIFQLKLTLTDSFPEIWRRVLVPDECIATFDRAFSALGSQAIHPLPQIQDVHEAPRTAGITLVRP